MADARTLPGPAGNSPKLVTCFRELLVCASNSNTMPGYEFTQHSPGVFTLQRDGLTQAYIAPEIWQDMQAANPQDPFEAAFRGALAVQAAVLVGDATTAPHVPEHQSSDLLIHALTLPIGELAVRTQVDNLRRVLLLLSDGRRERAAVEDTAEEVKYVLSISRELNGERDLARLLSLILNKAREVTAADAGSIYTIDRGNDSTAQPRLCFHLAQNDSVPTDLTQFHLPINENSIVGTAVLRRTSIHFPDLYRLDPDSSRNPYGASHDRNWDRRIGYESHSMLTIPMYDISHDVIGVIQLINHKTDFAKRLRLTDDFATFVTPFGERDIEYAEIVAQQAGIALENAHMAEEIQTLFHGFVNASVTAIEQRDPTTSGHSHRVAALTTGLALALERVDTGPYKNVRFTADQMREIEYASLLHDFGKLGVREQVLVKSKKLYDPQMRLLRERFQLVSALTEIEYYRQYVKYIEEPSTFPLGVNGESFRRERDMNLKQLSEFMAFIEAANEPTVLEQGGFERLKDIANCHFIDCGGHQRAYLENDEVNSLSVSRGSLTRDEFMEIQAHVIHTYEFLRKIPWGRKLANVPQFAAKHHEKLDGTGYPTAAAAPEIPVQSRMMTIADIFDALTAADRPYKRAVPLPKALDILGSEVKAGKLDSDLFKIFVDSRTFDKVVTVAA